MEEADRVAGQIAIIDQGKIIIQGTSAELKAKTNKSSLEDAFIELTGHAIRHEEVSSADRMRMHRRMWRR